MHVALQQIGLLRGLFDLLPISWMSGIMPSSHLKLFAGAESGLQGLTKFKRELILGPRVY